MSDYIDRDAALAFNVHVLMDPNGKYKSVAYVVAQGIGEHIKRLPAADVVEVRHGRWADHREQDGAWSCTACGEEVTICSCGKDKTWEFPYCPNCGAKMDGEADDECVEALRDWLKQEVDE